jgi:transcriptional regulator with XRE-family HTH domain
MLTDTGANRGDESREEALHRFVRERRLRIAPESQFLGQRPRWPRRLGKRVTQEELADHLGISRQWYARFEAGSTVGFSTTLLGHLSDLLRLSPTERVELVRLAMPKLAPAVCPSSIELYEALRDMRKTVKRLWSATSEAEILQVAAEETRGLLPIFEATYAQPGLLAAFRECVVVCRPGVHLADYAEMAEAFIGRLTPEQIALSDAARQASPMGSFVPYEAFPPDLLRPFRQVLHEYGLAWESVLTAHIRGRSGSGGIVGGVSSYPHDVTEVERATLSTIAEFASLALR